VSQTSASRPGPVRAPRDGEDDLPLYAVWEITLRCDHACSHCGSRAVRPRPDELSTAELLDTADQLVRLGTREVTLIGGEAYLRPDVYELVRHLTRQGVVVTMQTGGRGLTDERVERLVEAGLRGVGVSIDGPEAVHDLMRDSPGSYRAALAAMKRVKQAGMSLASNMQVNRLSWHFLREHYEVMQAHGVQGWRLQITVPMGRAADHPQWLLEPWRVLEVMDTLAELQADAIERTRAAGRPATEAMSVQAGNNLGYFGPHEAILRTRPGQRPTHYQGCVSGRFTIGLESDGTVKGCPSLPTASYTGGNVREVALEQIWREAPELNFVQQRDRSELWGFCKGCYYADVCMAGCSWTAHCTLGRRGNQPYCYHRAHQLKQRGVRERLERVEAAEGVPFDHGRFQLVEEPWSSD